MGTGKCIKYKQYYCFTHISFETLTLRFETKSEWNVMNIIRGASSVTVIVVGKIKKLLIISLIYEIW